MSAVRRSVWQIDFPVPGEDAATDGVPSVDKTTTVEFANEGLGMLVQAHV